MIRSPNSELLHFQSCHSTRQQAAGVPIPNLSSDKFLCAQCANGFPPAKLGRWLPSRRCGTPASGLPVPIPTDVIPGKGPFGHPVVYPTPQNAVADRKESEKLVAQRTSADHSPPGEDSGYASRFPLAVSRGRITRRAQISPPCTRKFGFGPSRQSFGSMTSC